MYKEIVTCDKCGDDCTKQHMRMTKKVVDTPANVNDRHYTFVYDLCMNCSVEHLNFPSGVKIG